MALEVLSHKSHGYLRDLTKYCMTHHPLNFPVAEKDGDIANSIFSLGKNSACFRIESRRSNEYTVHHIGTSKILFGNIPLRNTCRWKWEVVMERYEPNPDMYFGIDWDQNTSDP